LLVVQLYVGDAAASVARPPRELRAFAKVDLDAGESRSVSFRLAARDLSYWSTSAGAWVLEPGEFTFAVGASSRDLRLTTTIDVPGPPLSVELGPMATLHEWLADPTGARLLREVVGTDPGGAAARHPRRRRVALRRRQLPDQRPCGLPGQRPGPEHRRRAAQATAIRRACLTP
jgi:Fibronectin type III-like domain